MIIILCWMWQPPGMTQIVGVGVGIMSPSKPTSAPSIENLLWLIFGWSTTKGRKVKSTSETYPLNPPTFTLDYGGNKQTTYLSGQVS